MIIRILRWFSIEGLIISLMIAGAAFMVIAILVIIFTAPNTYQRIDACMALERYTQAECVMIVTGH